MICTSKTAGAGLSLTVCPHLELEGIVPAESSYLFVSDTNTQLLNSSVSRYESYKRVSTSLRSQSVKRNKTAKNENELAAGFQNW